MSEQQGACIVVNFHRREMEKKMRAMSSEVLTELRQEGKLCDAVIKVGDAEFKAHKIILSSCSLYFRTLFTGAFATSDKQICTIPGVSPEMMDLIINFAYTHSVTVTERNVVEVLAAADQFMVPGIVQTCCFFLEDQLCLRNCVGIWRLVDFYHCPQLRDKVFHYIVHNFEDIASVSQELLELSAPQLAAFIEHDHLNVTHESTALQVILRWINQMPDERHGHISVLLSKVRLGLVTPGFLQHEVINNAVIRESIECIPIINKALSAMFDFQDNGHSKSVYRNLLTRPRLPSAILLVTGGKYANDHATSLEAYDARAGCWVTMNAANVWRTHHGAAALNSFVYLIGGCVHEVYLNTVQRFDPITYTWHWVAPMNVCRGYVSVAVLNGCIYAMGGYNGQVYHRSVECYNPERDKWTMMSPMHAKRCGASSTTLNGKMYICGGYNGVRSLSTAECYDPHTNHWTTLARMTSCRSSLGVAAYRGRIYAVGGTSNGTTHVCSAEAYNPRTNRWTPIPSMRIPRSYFGIEVVDNQLFVVGGHNSFTSVLSVERYDEELGLWYRAADIEMSRSGLSCCVLHGLYSVAEKLFPRGPLSSPNVEEAAGGSI